MRTVTIHESETGMTFSDTDGQVVIIAKTPDGYVFRSLLHDDEEYVEGIVPLDVDYRAEGCKLMGLIEP